MTRTEQADRLKEIIRLYEDKKLSLREIAARFDVSWQAIHDRLVRAKVSLRPKRPIKHSFDCQTIIQLYENEKLTIREVARRLKINTACVSKELEKLGVEKRSKGFSKRKQQELYSLETGESILINRPQVTRPYESLYDKAKKIGIRISIKSIDENTMQIKRIE
jgi:predicted DNA-binding protein YlxM (UPF0122 family)